MTEVSAAIAVALSKADAAVREKIKTKIIELFNRAYPDGKVSVPAPIRVICRKKEQ